MSALLIYATCDGHSHIGPSPATVLILDAIFCFCWFSFSVGQKPYTKRELHMFALVNALVTLPLCMFAHAITSH